MLMKIIKATGKPTCVVLYSALAALAAKKKYAPLLALAGSHAAEFVFIGRKVAKENNINALVGLVNCLAFGLTWWVPLKFDKDSK